MQAQSPATSPWEGMKGAFVSDGHEAPSTGVGSLSAMAKYQSEMFNAAITGSVATSIGLEELRQLTRAQVELEKMARTDGSYFEFGLTFFNTKMSTSRECKPVYIGGTYSSISFTEVLQTSASTVSSALGQIAGHGISIDNQGYIGNFQANDYGIIMIVGTIMPDVYYHQGLEKNGHVNISLNFSYRNALKWVYNLFLTKKSCSTVINQLIMICLAIKTHSTI